MHLSIKFESCSRLFFCSCHVVEYLPPRSAKFASPELMHYETYGSIKLALPIVHRRHMFSYPIWLLYLLSPVLVGALGWGVVIYLVAYYLWRGFQFLMGWVGEWGDHPGWIRNHPCSPHSPRLVTSPSFWVISAALQVSSFVSES